MTKLNEQGEIKTGRSSAAIIGVGGGIALGMWLASAMSLLDDRGTITSRPVATVTRHVTEPVSATVLEPSAIETPRLVSPALAQAASPAEAPRTVVLSEVVMTVAPAEAVKTIAPPAAPEALESIEAPRLVMTVPVTAPRLHDRMKPVLARGTRINLAVEGFSDAEQFATLAHAARNTQVPFILLKHRVLTERLSLADAIRASKPALDAEAEVVRARKAAKSDLAALASAN